MIVASLENIGLVVNRQNILRDINLQLHKGKITTLIGPNGGGKTSIARILLGIVKPTTGSVSRDNVKIGYMPQKLELDKTIPMRVIDFLRLAAHNVSEKEIVNAVKNFPKFNLEKILYSQIHDISGGQLQKVLFMRASLAKPDLLVLDEPTQYMDINAVEEFYRVIDDIRNQNNCAILLISHDLVTVMQKTDFVFCVNNHVCCHGAPESVNEHPEYLALLGKEHRDLGVYKHHHNHKH
jgi:zinc transport system ATP-binding protein